MGFLRGVGNAVPTCHACDKVARNRVTVVDASGKVIQNTRPYCERHTRACSGHYGRDRLQVEPLRGAGSFDASDVFGFEPPTDPEPPRASALLATARRGDVVQVGRTKWIVFSPVGTFQAYAYKHPSAHQKAYMIEATDRESGDFAVWQTGGSGQRLKSEPEVIGPARIIGHEPAALE